MLMPMFMAVPQWPALDGGPIMPAGGMFMCMGMGMGMDMSPGCMCMGKQPMGGITAMPAAAAGHALPAQAPALAAAAADMDRRLVQARTAGHTQQHKSSNTAAIQHSDDSVNFANHQRKHKLPVAVIASRLSGCCMRMQHTPHKQQHLNPAQSRR
jgi:hypothetical protein